MVHDWATILGRETRFEWTTTVAEIYWIQSWNNVVKAIIKYPWLGMVYTTYKNGEIGDADLDNGATDRLDVADLVGSSCRVQRFSMGKSLMMVIIMGYNEDIMVIFPSGYIYIYPI